MQRIRLIGILGLMGSLMLAPPTTAQDAAQTETQNGLSMPTIAAPSLNPPTETTAPAATPPAAVNDEAYIIHAIAVDVTAASAVAARDKAIFDGQRTALTQLLERMEAAKAINPAKLSDNKIAALVKNFEITSEKASNVRYIASMNVRFKPQAVQNLLNNAGVSFVASPTMPIVILPISDSNGRPVLWEENTTWRNALEQLEHKDSLQPVLVPNGELSDIGAVGTQAAIAGDAGSLGAIATLHSASAVIVAQITGDVIKLSPKQPLTIQLTRYDSGGQKSDNQTVVIPATDNSNSQLADAASRVQDFIMHRSLNTTAEAGKANPAQTAQAAMQLYAPLTTLPELTRLRQKLGALSAIQRINIQSITREGADLVLEFNGDAVQLQQGMMQQGLSLSQSMTGQWQIRSN